MDTKARRKMYELDSFSGTNSDEENNNGAPPPPWCSSGKVREKKKSKRVPSPTWEIRSSYPLRQNIWEFLREDKNFCKRKYKKPFCKQTLAKNKRRSGKTAILLMLLFIALGMTIFLWPNIIQKEISKFIPGEKLISLLGIQRIPFEEECCARMNHLAAALLRTEETLRSTLRMRTTMMLSAQTIRDDSQLTFARHRIEGATVTKGTSTKEWGGLAYLWGVVPLWRAAPPPDIVLATRKPVPSDCWPFRGSYGELIIDLPRKMAVQGMSIEHVRPDTARSAPKKFVLYGILENSTLVETSSGEYKYKGPAKQFYTTIYHNLALRRVILRILSNQGNEKYTCVYRLHFYENIA